MTDIATLSDTIARVKQEIAKVIIGQERVVDLALVTMLARAHALIEGVPGIAKTLLIRTVARVISCDTKRIQFTPDLMPADILGTNTFNLQRNEFTLVKGPVFTTLLLADEVNRAPAKTQSALLQCMQERMVSIDGIDYPLHPWFTVFATQNPIEYEGTYPLPEAQKDRFLLKIDMAYPEEAGETELARRMLNGTSPEQVLASGAVQPVLTLDALDQLHAATSSIAVKDDLVDYIVRVVRLTRLHRSVLVGAGPRATQSMILAARMFAAVSGRDFATPDDVKVLAIPVLGHRLILRPEFEVEGVTVNEVISQILSEVPVPR